MELEGHDTMTFGFAALHLTVDSATISNFWACLLASSNAGLSSINLKFGGAQILN